MNSVTLFLMSRNDDFSFFCSVNFFLSLSLSAVPLNDRRMMETRAMSMDREDGTDSLHSENDIFDPGKSSLFPFCLTFFYFHLSLRFAPSKKPKRKLIISILHEWEKV